MRNLSYENELCMQFYSHANQSHFHKNGFVLRLALKQRHKGTRKWPITAFRSFQRNAAWPTMESKMSTWACSKNLHWLKTSEIFVLTKGTADSSDEIYMLVKTCLSKVRSS